jgi:hypothetical protein
MVADTRPPPTPSTTPEHWLGFSDAEQARWRCRLIREMAWIVWDSQPLSWYVRRHAEVLALKTAAARPREEPCVCLPSSP